MLNCLVFSANFVVTVCEMCFAFDVLLCAVYFAYALPSPLAAGGALHFRFTILLQFLIFTEDALSQSETRCEIKNYACFYFGNCFCF